VLNCVQTLQETSMQTNSTPADMREKVLILVRGVSQDKDLKSDSLIHIHKQGTRSTQISVLVERSDQAVTELMHRIRYQAAVY